MFMAGIVPGILMGVALVIVVLLEANKHDIKPSRKKATAKERWSTFKDAFWGLMMPVIILGGIYGGIFTPTEAAAVSAIENMVTGNCNYIVAMVSDTSCDDALKAAQEKGVKIIECGVETAVHDLVLITDQYSIGTQIGDMAADWLNSQLGGKGNIVVYTTYQNQDMQDRGQGIQDAIKEKAPNVNILEVVDIGKDVVGAGTTTTETMLQKYSDLNGIVCYGDAAAVESVEAVKAAGKDNENFGVFACDGTNQALKGINDGTCMRGTMYFEPVGSVMAEYIQQMVDGKTVDEAVETPIHAVTKANIADYYKADK